MGDTSIFYAGGTWYDDNYHSHYALWRSDNSGKTWKGISPAMSGSPCDVAVDPKTPSRLFAGTDLGLYRSENAGASWTESVEGMTAKSIQCLDADKAQKTVYAGTLGGSILKIRR